MGGCPAGPNPPSPPAAALLPPAAAPPLPPASPLLPPSNPLVPAASLPSPAAATPVAPADPVPASPELAASRATGEKEEDEELSRVIAQEVEAKPEKEDTELESSRVKEAALDDKLGIELRSIVEQIQDMQREVADALKDGGEV